MSKVTPLLVVLLGCIAMLRIQEYCDEYRDETDSGLAWPQENGLAVFSRAYMEDDGAAITPIVWQQKEGELQGMGRTQP